MSVVVIRVKTDGGNGSEKNSVAPEEERVTFEGATPNRDLDPVRQVPTNPKLLKQKPGIRVLFE